MIRKQAGQVCKGTDPCISVFVGFTQEGFESFTSTYVLGCKEWKPGLEMTALGDVLKAMDRDGALKSHEAHP